MSTKVVLYFRALDLTLSPRGYLSAARALSEQAAAMGGHLVSSGAAGFAYEFEEDALEDAIELSSSVVRGSVDGQTFSIGISAGRLEQVEDASSRAPLVWGPPLVRAAALARGAERHQVLVDASLGAVQRGELLTEPTDADEAGGDRLRGLSVDLEHPWRSDLAESAPSVERPAMIGRPELGELLVSAGTLGLIRANRGYGGTRFIDELEHELGSARILRATPHPLGEPLGALRRAMLGAVSTGQPPGELAPSVGQSLDALLGGEGLDPESATELLISWLTPKNPKDPSGVVLLEDAGEVDADSLEVIHRAAAASSDPPRVIARINGTDPVPKALSLLKVSAEVRLGPLSVADSALLAKACLRDELDDRAASRWGNRGGGVPLAIVEAIYEALEGGDLVLRDGKVASRALAAGASTAMPAKHWIHRRWSYLGADGQALLFALAILGGEAELRDLADVIKARTNFGLDIAPRQAGLQRTGWLSRVQPGVLRLSSATAQEVILSKLGEDEFMSWHSAAADVIASRHPPLAVASATTHAVLSADGDRARELAARAAGAARAVGLEMTADAFEAFADSGDVAPLAERNLFTSQREASRRLSSLAPPPDDDEEEAPTVRRPVAPSLPVPAAAPAKAKSNKPVRKGLSEPPGGTVAALRTGDLDTVERVARQLRTEDGRAALADRLQAMAELGRGQTGDALRRLREAAEQAKREGSADQCRAYLALGVALAAAARTEDALLAVLEGLARARETKDSHGERACCRFIAQLAERSGQSAAVRAWQSVAGE